MSTTHAPCRTCGATDRERWTAPALTPGKEIVVVVCGSCERRLSRYERNKTTPTRLTH